MLVNFGDIILNVPATKIILLSTCNPLIVIDINNVDSHYCSRFFVLKVSLFFNLEMFKPRS